MWSHDYYIRHTAALSGHLLLFRANTTQWFNHLAKASCKFFDDPSEILVERPGVGTIAFTN